jgi:hypothetical protein
MKSLIFIVCLLAIIAELITHQRPRSTLSIVQQNKLAELLRERLTPYRSPTSGYGMCMIDTNDILIDLHWHYLRRMDYYGYTRGVVEMYYSTIYLIDPNLKINKDALILDED